VDADAAPGGGQRDSPGTYAELERGSLPREVDEEADERADDRRVGHVAMPLVVPLRDALTEVVLGHRRRRGLSCRQ